jgi:hypothetical protein
LIGIEGVKMRDQPKHIDPTQDLNLEEISKSI